ncbi:MULTISPECIES: copper chaperone PCu(A)C [unclassified Ruegeria]|uniref:copper chaperone PCu(A)C n=1 Tax=unclassified Ruegeria TaxID=2625375 RepID=UPI001487A696|nr:MULTISPECIES: copper chaperone PCu(A)C [unclassified Ruegeria]
MTLKSTVLVAMASFALATTVAAESSIKVDDSYARSSGATAKAGAAFMMIVNDGDTADRLIGVRSEAAARVELHTHEVDDNGVARMMEVEEGFEIPAGESHALERGGDHVMFMGLTQPFEQGVRVPVTLIFENAGEIDIEIPVDLERKADPGHGDGHGAHSH